MSRRRPKIGDVVQIELPDGIFAYGRVLDDAGVALYAARSDVPGQPPIGSRDYAFIAGVAERDVQAWPVVGHDPSRDADDDWPPPQYIENPPGSFRIYHRGQMRPATKDETRGLEPQAIYKGSSVIDRLMTGLRPKTPAEAIREILKRRKQQEADHRAAAGES